MGIQYYAKTIEHRTNNALFGKWALDNKIELRPVSPVKAPWHFYAVIGYGCLYPQRVDFYPHKVKGTWNGRTAEGTVELSQLLQLVHAAVDGFDDDVTGV